jgi:hypothetical protein
MKKSLRSRCCLWLVFVKGRSEGPVFRKHRFRPKTLEEIICASVFYACYGEIRNWMFRGRVIRPDLNCLTYIWWTLYGENLSDNCHWWFDDLTRRGLIVMTHYARSNPFGCRYAIPDDCCDVKDIAKTDMGRLVCADIYQVLMSYLVWTDNAKYGYLSDADRRKLEVVSVP